LETNLETLNDQTLLVGGDFNHSLDTLNGKTNTNKQTSDKVNALIETFDLCDVFRLLNPERKLFTWPSNTHPPIICRLDYLLLSSSSLNCVTHNQIKTGYSSDHSIVVMKLNLIHNDNSQ